MDYDELLDLVTESKVNKADYRNAQKYLAKEYIDVRSRQVKDGFNSAKKWVATRPPVKAVVNSKPGQAIGKFGKKVATTVWDKGPEAIMGTASKVATPLANKLISSPEKYAKKKNGGVVTPEIEQKQRRKKAWVKIFPDAGAALAGSTAVGSVTPPGVGCVFFARELDVLRKSTNPDDAEVVELMNDIAKTANKFKNTVWDKPLSNQKQKQFSQTKTIKDAAWEKEKKAEFEKSKKEIKKRVDALVAKYKKKDKGGSVTESASSNLDAWVALYESVGIISSGEELFLMRCIRS